MNENSELTEAEMYELKMKATEFYNENKVPENLENVLNQIFYENPNDVYGRLSQFFDHLSNPPSVQEIKISSTLDSSGNTAMLCDFICELKNEVKTLSKFSLSLMPELLILPPIEEGSDEPTPESILEKCDEFSKEITKRIKQLNPAKQKDVDSVLRDWINEKEISMKVATEIKIDEEHPRTPTPSSGKKKKAPSAKKGKAPEKAIVPKQPFEFRAQGCSVISAISLASATAASNYLRIPLFQHVQSLFNNEESDHVQLPICAISAFNGGKAAPGKLNLAKSVFVFGKPGYTYEETFKRLISLFHQIGKSTVIKTAYGVTGANGGYQIPCEKVEQLLDLIQEAATILELPMDKYFSIGIDCAASELFDFDKGRYEIVTGTMKSPDELVEYYKDLTTRYSAVQYLSDPLRKEDQEQYFKLCEAISERCLVVGGPAIFGSFHELTEVELQARVTTGVLLQYGACATLTDMNSAMQTANDNDKVSIISHTSPDVCGNNYTDIGVGLMPDIVLFGGPGRGENIDRINRLLEIEKICTDSSKKMVYGDLRYPIIKSPEEPISEEMKETIATPASSQKAKKK